METISFDPISFDPILFDPIAFELNVYDRNYEKYVFINKKDLQEDISWSNPLTNKWFHKDIIDESGKVIKSPYMNNDAIPGVLVINGNTYGHLNGDLKAKLLYKCIPDDKSLPIFLIPYEYKCNTFNKNKHNKYVTFRIKEWIDKHPIGIITNIFGNVNENESFYQYQLCCKNLNNSISGFNKATINALKIIEREKIIQQLSIHLQDRRMYEIFSIDPYGSKDIDDAMGITTIEGKVIVSIYIANVALVLDHVKLWDYFSKRISSIYLPNVKIPMLPNILSDDLCSLIESEDRCAYCMDVLIHEDNTISITFKSVIINVKKNYVYEEKSLLDNLEYLSILKIARTLNINYKYVNSIDDSHHVVEFFMILMNYQASKLLLERKSGIFRITSENNMYDVNSCIPTNIRAIINNISGSYCTYENLRSHSLIGEGLDSYVHITSPIRRVVDLCNMIEMQIDIMSDKAKDFAKSWMSAIDDINAITKTIKKVQNNCNLLSLYTKEGLKKYTGIIFNKKEYKEDILKFSIYIPDLKMISTLKTREKLENYSNVVVSTHIFVDEDNIMKKIRLQLA